MMVKETCIVFEIQDIKAFRVQCGECKDEVVLSLDGRKQVPTSCPLCHHDWVDHANDPRGSFSLQLLKALRAILFSDQLPTTVKLELDDGSGE